MEKTLQKKIFRHFLGWSFIVLGVLGCFLPILQGFLFLFVGSIILAPEVPFFHRQLNRFRYRYPEIFFKARLYTRRIQRSFHRRRQ
ncbi:Putative transmembrane protein (PGPGW) [Syntrophus gentianae]|uniref:Putative transmembrane protein (PGPGW) n=1 Tax=Syntrophus gentianae TaxID=43775 RepID=A0A1H7XYG7_9BACT|nr:Putative transmembrane protein (PGPGW) [Syntrophus gentianae]